MDEIFDWCNANKLTLNLDKTNYILIQNHQNKFSLIQEIKMNNVALKRENNPKFLGITINQSMNWEAHINRLRSDLNKISGLLFHASKFLPTSTLILLYNALAHSKIVYCLEAWGNAPTTHLNKILVVQRRMVRNIFKKTFREHSALLFKKS